MQHLFFKCPSVKKIIKEIEAIFNRSGLTANIEIKELNIMAKKTTTLLYLGFNHTNKEEKKYAQLFFFRQTARIPSHL